MIKPGDQAPVYTEGSKIIYRASGLGGCLTALAAARQGLEKQQPRGRQAAVYKAGHEAEDRFFELYPHGNRQMRVELAVTNRIVVVAHLDAYDKGILEVKSQSNKEWNSWEPNHWEKNPLWIKYSWQVSVCMHAKESKVWVYRFNRDTEEIACILVETPFWTTEQIFERILEVESLALEDKLVCTSPEFFCDYPQLHPGPEPVEDPELEDYVANYLVVKKRNDESSTDLKYWRDKIDERMQGAGYGPKVLLLSGASVSRSEFDTEPHMVKGGHQVRITIAP